ncbi:MAG TPA: sulfur carrier protein ThiS [Chloroflexota bacterium]|nr:sulfur carrier protein ThiS [Chloroflexota bacterium]HZU05663.1 sulfur carrier protein ThiS [Chloroflexota bacterium]
MITLTVNGKPREIPEPMTLLRFLQAHNIDPRLIAVEHNGEIVRRDRYAEVVLQAGDRLEIVHMVGGGAA